MGTNRVILRNALLATLAFGLLGGYFFSAYYYLERRQTEPGHAAFTSQRRQRQGELYTDDEARQILKRWGQDGSPEKSNLNVVGDGITESLGSVLHELGLDLDRLGEVRVGGADWVVFLTWQLSPSYDLFCMSPKSLRRPEPRLDYEDPRRWVYGFKIIPRNLSRIR